MNYHPLFFTAILLGSLNLRFNLFYNKDLLSIHDDPFWDWIAGTAKRFALMVVLSLIIVALTPITPDDFDRFGPMLYGLFSWCVFGNCCISWAGILLDDEYEWRADGCPNIDLYGIERLTPSYLRPISVLCAMAGVASVLVQFFR